MPPALLDWCPCDCDHISASCICM